MFNEKEKLQEIIRLSSEVTKINDLDLLLEKILAKARAFVNADAGSIYIREGDQLRFSHSQNETLSKKLPSGKKLIYTSFALPINNHSIAGYVANTGEILNIADVYEIPPCLPYGFSKDFDNVSHYRSKSMLTIPLKTTRGDIDGVLQMINAQNYKGNIISFSKEDESLMSHFANTATIAIERAQMTRAIILRMISMAELRDPMETGAHVNRVAGYSVEIFEAWAKQKGLPQKTIDEKKDILRLAAMLHDVGKVAISDLILKKPARLNQEEFEIIKQHTFLGARLFANPKTAFDEAAFEVVLNHHEHWNGKGYPGFLDLVTGNPLPGFDDGGKPRPKKGEEIPVFGRVVALADVYDALSSLRSYKKSWDEERVIDLIRGSSGQQFDPAIVEAFFSCLEMIHVIKKQYPD
ncbi:MAG: HD domain-containing protein [Thermodesulfobacteriota bacterium]|nr:MAG: HD domain-containing protein [Thermodesulfobacteriota bacterium]